MKDKETKISLNGIIITAVLVLICLMWTIPTIGIFITSFRTADATNSTGWWKAFSTLKSFTLDNYNQVLLGQRYSVGNAGGGTSAIRGATMLSAFLSSITVTVPAVIIPIFIAAAAAYGFAWLNFQRSWSSSCNDYRFAGCTSSDFFDSNFA